MFALSNRIALWLLVHAFQRLQIIHSDSLSASRLRYTHIVTSHKMHAFSLPRFTSPPPPLSLLVLFLSLCLALRHGIPRNRTQRGDHALEYLSFPRDRILRRRACRQATRIGAKMRSLRRNQATNRKTRSLLRAKIMQEKDRKIGREKEKRGEG